MFSFLISFIHCQIQTTQISTTFPMIVLNSFGFTKNAIFEISIESTYNSSFTVYLLEESPTKLQKFQISDGIHLCRLESPFTSIYNRTSPPNVTKFVWFGTIQEDRVLTPMIISCNNQLRNKYTIQTHYKNENYLIDYRYKHASLCYSILSIGYFIIVILWIINSISYSYFSIPLYHIGLFLVSLKSLYMALNSEEWNELRVVEKPNSVLEHSIALTQIIYYSLFSYFIGVFIVGWGIIMEHIPLKQHLIFMVCPLCVLNIIFIIDEIDGLVPMLICWGIICIFFTFYFFNIIFSLVDFVRLVDSDFEGEVRDKINFMKYHIFDIIFIGSLAVFLISVFIRVISPLIVDMMYELCIFFYFVILFYRMAYRSSYQGTFSDTSLNNDPNQLKIINLQGPGNQNELVLFQNDNFMEKDKIIEA